MALKSKINTLEKKLNIKPREMVVAFSDNNRILVKRDGEGEINKLFKNFGEVKEYYKDRNVLILKISNIYDIDQELKSNISNNIEAIELNKDEPINYDELISQVKMNAQKISNLSSTLPNIALDIEQHA